MSALYDDLDTVHKRIHETLSSLCERELRDVPKEELAAWMKASLLELVIDLRAIAENRLNKVSGFM